MVGPSINLTVMMADGQHVATSKKLYCLSCNGYYAKEVIRGGNRVVFGNSTILSKEEKWYRN